MSFVRRRLEAQGVDVYKTAFQDRRRRRADTYSWEDSLARIARFVTAALNRPHAQGLRPTPDGFYPVKDLLNLPALRGLDFFTFERAIRAYRFHRMYITYNPRNTNAPPNDEANASWWIALRPSRVVFPPRRVVRSDKTCDLVYKVPSALWETVREHGISGGLKPLKFSTRPIVPTKYIGDHTFIRLDSQKILNATNYPLYHIRKHGTRPRFHLFSETFTTNAPMIPPSTFKSATRITVERFPLILPNGEKKKTRSKKKKKEKEAKMVVLQSGIEALGRFGCGGMLRGTKLLRLWKEQEKQKAETSSPTQKKVAVTDPVASTPSIMRNARSDRRLSTKDPPNLMR